MPSLLYCTASYTYTLALKETKGLKFTDSQSSSNIADIKDFIGVRDLLEIEKPF